MNSLLYKNKDVKTLNCMKAIKDLHLDLIVKILFTDVGKQKKILSIISNVLIEEDSINYRQECVKDMFYKREIYYSLQKISLDIEKCYASFNQTKQQRNKLKLRSDIEYQQTTMLLKDYNQDLKRLIQIYQELKNIFDTYSISSRALKKLKEDVNDIVNNQAFNVLLNVIEKIDLQHSAYEFTTLLDDYLVPVESKFILCTGKYQQPKVSLFKKKSCDDNLVLLNLKATDDFSKILIESFNRTVMIIEEMFLGLINKILFIQEEFIFFEFASSIYDTICERKQNICFPKISSDSSTNYYNACDLYLLIKYIKEGYSRPIYPQSIKINKENLLIIGNNNTGKTVFIRTLGINQILFQNGMFIPCIDATIGIKDNIITIFSGEENDTDVGGRFEKEVIEIKEIIDDVNESSLVIINEIFQSTFAKDGMNALVDILSYFNSINVSFICVTHLIKKSDILDNIIANTVSYTTTTEENHYKIEKI